MIDTVCETQIIHPSSSEFSPDAGGKHKSAPSMTTQNTRRARFWARIGSIINASTAIYKNVCETQIKNSNRHRVCGITTFNPTTRNEEGLEVRERSLVRCPREGITVWKRLDKEGRHTWPVTLSRSEVLKPNGRSRIRSLRLKGIPERDSN